jgi:hypothetical protein
MRGSRIGVAIMAAGVLAASLALLAPAVEAAAGKKPDLVPTAGKLTNEDKPFAFIDRQLGNSWRGTVKNRGEESAGPTLTRVYISTGRLRRPAARRLALMDAATGRIRAGGRERVEADGRRPDQPPGRYNLYVCADAKDQEKESNEDNNCRFVKPKTFYLTYQTWAGSFSGNGPGAYSSGGPTKESWASSDVSYGFSEQLFRGLFVWDLSGGAVNYTHSGISNGCTYNGSGTLPLDPDSGDLFVDYDEGTYRALAYSVDGTYPIVENCGGSIAGLPGPRHSLVLATDFAQVAPESTALADTRIDGDVFFSWSLAGR